MHDINIHVPETLEEALRLLGQYGENARVIAGGTAIVNQMKQSLVSVEHLISLQGLGGKLRTIDLLDGVIHIGGLVTHRDVETSDLVRESAPILSEVYKRVATVRIRNMATVGGGLAHSDPAQDPSSALIATESSVSLVSEKAKRTVRVEDLSTDYYETAIANSEILTEVTVPVMDVGLRYAYYKYLPRTADDYATVAVCAVAAVENGICRAIKLALGALGPTPIRASVVEEMLLNKAISSETINSAAQAVTSIVSPLDDLRGTAEYKKDMAVVFTRKALLDVLT